MESRWSSSGRLSQDSRQRTSSRRFRKRWANCGVIQRTSKTGSSSCGCSTTLWDVRGNEELCENNSKSVGEDARRFPRGHWSFLGLGSEKKWYGTFHGIPIGSWSRTAEKMLMNFANSGHPIFRCTSALERGQSRCKGGGKTTRHFTASYQDVQLLLKVVKSVNQLSLFGAAADVIEELSQNQRAPGKAVALDHMEQEMLIQLPLAEVQASDERQGNLLQELRAKIWKTTRRREAIQIVLRCRFQFGRSWTNLWMDRRLDLCAENSHHLVTKRNIVQKVGSEAMKGSALSWKWFAKHLEDPALKLKVHLFSKTKPFHGLELWAVLKSMSEKQCRSKKKKLRGDPLQRRNQYWKPSSTSIRNFIPRRERKWIDIEVQKSKDTHWFQMSNFITQLLPHKEVGREEDAGVLYDRIVEKCNEYLSNDSRYWSDDVKQKWNVAPQRCWTKENVYCLLPTWPGRILYLRAIQGHSGKAYSGNTLINPALRDNVLLPKIFLPSMFITSDTEMKWYQYCVTVWYQEDSAPKHADVQHSSPL